MQFLARFLYWYIDCIESGESLGHKHRRTKKKTVVYIGSSGGQLLSVWLPAQPTPTVWLYGSMAALSVQHVVNIVGANLAANMTIITTIAIVTSNTIDDNVL